jgi:hypothetical protein
MDREMRKLLNRLIVQNKEQQDQIKAMNLMLEEVLAQQTTIIIKLHATEFLWKSESKGKIPLKIQMKKLPRKWSTVWARSQTNFNQAKRQTHAVLSKQLCSSMLPSYLDGSNVS